MEIHINKDYSRNKLQIYAYEIVHLGRQFYQQSVDGNISRVFVEEVSPASSEIQPIITLPLGIGLGFIECIAEYCKSNGISIKEQSNLEGKLQVMDKHQQFLESNLQLFINSILKLKP